MKKESRPTDGPPETRGPVQRRRRRYSAATPVATRMMVVGERSGDMGQMLAQIARFHDDQTARTVEWFTKAFEPVLMAVLGLAIGGVVVLMYMPIFELAGSLR